MVQANTTMEAPDFEWANESVYAQAVYDTLLQASPTGVIQPHLATAWSYNAAKTVLTLTLRTGVKFTDGNSFNASTAAANLEAFKKGTSSSASELADMASATAASPTKLVITLKQPVPPFLTYLTQNAGLQEDPTAFSSSTATTVPVGSGPYELDTKATVPGSSYVYTANPGYWDKAEQHYSKIVINVYLTPTALLDAIEGGQIDASNLLGTTLIPQVKSAGYTVYGWEYNWEGLDLMDRNGTMSKPLGNVKVRQAINYALDRPALLQALNDGYGTVTDQIYPPGGPAYDSALDSYYSYNPAKAKQLLAAAGYPNGFTLAMPEDTGALGAENYTLIAQQLSAIGIKVNYTNYQTAQFFDAMLAPKFPATFLIFQQDPNPWQEAQYVTSPTAEWNPFHTTNATVNGYVKTMQTGSASAAAAAAKSLNQYLVQNAWYAPFYRPQSDFVADKNTKVVLQNDGLPNLWDITPQS